MSERLQTWILANTKGLQYLVNERLAKRPGAIGRLFTHLSMGPRQYSRHSIGRIWRALNFLHMFGISAWSAARPTISRFIGVNHGPLNYTGIVLWFFATGIVLNSFRFTRLRDTLTFNAQDQTQFWMYRYRMTMPPQFLHNRLSAHYIEISNIFTIEMLKKYQVARKEILEEREKHSNEEKYTKLITNPNYVFEGLGADNADF